MRKLKSSDVRAALIALAFVVTQPCAAEDGALPSPPQAAESSCKADTVSGLGVEHSAPENEEPGDKGMPYDKVFRFEIDDGVYAHKRWCADDTQIPDTTEYYVRGKVRGYFRHYGYWSGRYLELSDEAGTVRVLKMNVTNAFERVMIFDGAGQLVVPLGHLSGPSATRLILDEFAKARIDAAIPMLWLLHYHGEGDGFDNMIAFSGWIMENKDAMLKLSAFLGPKTTRAIAFAVSFPLGATPERRKAFGELYPQGASALTDAVHKAWERN